jgi:hypothetical protein
MSAELITTKQFVNTNLKAYYRFESGALTTDSSGEGHTLTAISDPAEDASGKFGGAAAFDGDDGYTAADHADFKPTGNFTMGAWVKWDVSASGNDMIFQSYSAASNPAGIRFLIASGVIAFTIGRNTGTVANTDYKTITGDVDVSGGDWHFVVCVWDGSKMYIYVDGEEDINVAWANAPAYAATNYVRVGNGRRTTTEENFLIGSLDDVFLLNGTALSADQIKGIYDGKTNFKLNIGDDWKDADYAYINIGDAWKPVTEAKINIGDTWKSIF